MRLLNGIDGKLEIKRSLSQKLLSLHCASEPKERSWLLLNSTGFPQQPTCGHQHKNVLRGSLRNVYEYSLIPLLFLRIDMNARL